MLVNFKSNNSNKKYTLKRAKNILIYIITTKKRLLWLGAIIQ